MASNKEYHDFLQFLYFEGYTESYAEAEELLETLTDDEIEELTEVWNRKPWSETKIKRFDKEIKRQKNQRKKTPNSSLRPADQAALKRMQSGDPRPEPRKPKSSATRSARRQEPQQPDQPRYLGIQNVQYNEFDLVADYLFSEGFADTPEGAEVMAENISNNWVNEIIEKFNPKDYE